MKNQLSKREYKYRCKIIAENHLKKECQIYLGNYVVTEGLTYKEIYFDEALLHRMLTSYSFWRVGKAMSKTGVAIKQADELLRLAGDYATRHVLTCGDVLYEVGRKIREDGYTMQRCIKWLKEDD